jgi:hypothetical protein
MEHSVATPPILPTPTTIIKRQSMNQDLNGILVQCVHYPIPPMVPFSLPKNMDYHRLPTYIKSKFVYLQPGLHRFLQSEQSKWCITTRSSMKLENTHAIVEFIFKGIKPPCMVLGHESCRLLLAPDGRVVKKPWNTPVKHYLKVETHIL